MAEGLGHSPCKGRLMNAPLRLDVRDGVTRATLNRPERGNALDGETVEHLIDALEQASKNDTRAFVIQGEGRHFCTGFDIPEDGSDDAILLHRFIRIEMLLQRVYRAPFVTIAIAQGRTFGAGADLFLACDRRAATADAKFCFPGAGFGILLGTRRLVERVGSDEARRLVRTGAIIDATKAIDISLANLLLDPSGVEEMIAEEAVVSIESDTMAGLQHATATVDDDAALVDLVRSAAKPGLAARVASYRARVKAARQ